MAQETPQISLSRKLGIDVFAGALAAAVSSPITAGIDRGVTQNLAGTHKLMPALRQVFSTMIFKPHIYFRQPDYWLLFTLYGCTYVSANLTSSYFEYSNARNGIIIESTANAKLKTQQEFTSWLIISTTNALATLWKDQTFARLCHPSRNDPKSTVKIPKVGMVTYSIWFVRDSIAMGGVFKLPNYLTSFICSKFNKIDRERAYIIAQFWSPMLIMPAVVPFHMLGFDIYNNPTGSITQRITFMRRNFLSTLLFQCLRAIPPFSIGTNINTYLRDKYRQSR